MEGCNFVREISDKLASSQQIPSFLPYVIEACHAMEYQAKCKTFQMRKKVSYQDSISLRPRAQGENPYLTGNSKSMLCPPGIPAGGGGTLDAGDG
eukprot:scaffold595064_cov31-Prasinocladus_malaysianus.AAC.1